MVYLFLADGFETIEALTVVDVLRRGNVEVETVSITEELEVRSAHNITVMADISIKDIKDGAEMLVLPGGIPGTPNLENCPVLMKALKAQYEANGYIAAICAAPGILARQGYLKGKKATSYPSVEEELAAHGGEIVKEGAVVDGKIITGRAMGTAVDFALTILNQLKGEETAKKVAESIVYNK